MVMMLLIALEDGMREREWRDGDRMEEDKSSLLAQKTRRLRDATRDASLCAQHATCKRAARTTLRRQGSLISVWWIFS